MAIVWIVFDLNARIDALCLVCSAVQNILVHCHSGQSRSVTVVALYLFHEFPTQFRTYNDALQFVKNRRGLGNNPSVPEPNLTQLANQIAVDLYFLAPFE
jgi:protein tyrosine/serine phosphatase